MFENPRRGRQARNFTTNVPKILVLKSSSEQIFSRKLPLGAPEAFLAKTVETGDKNRDDFHCMEMSLVMSMWFILGDDWNNAQCLSRLSAFLPYKKSEFIFFVKTGYV